jgi:signal peptidase
VPSRHTEASGARPRAGQTQEVDISADDTADEDAPPTRHPVLSGIWTGITYGLLGLTLLLAALVIVVPMVAGAVPLTILSGSMEPTMPVGSLAVVRPVETDEVQIGDVITYLPNPEDPTAITHRVIAIDNNQDGTRTFTTQGDANDSPDDPVQDFQVRGEVWYTIPWLGYVNTAVNGEERTIAVYVVAGVFFLWAGTLWWRAWRRRRALHEDDLAGPGAGPDDGPGASTVPIA